MLGTAYYIIKDAKDFSKNFSVSQNLYVLSANNTVLSAFELSNKTYNEVDDLTYVSDSFKKYDFTNINDDYYKIVLIKTDTLDYINNVDLKKVLESKTPKEELLKIDDTIDAKDLKISDDEFRNYLFSYVITEVYNPKNINILLSNIKSGNIVMYEDTALFKSIKYVPNLFIKDITKSGNQTIFS